MGMMTMMLAVGGAAAGTDFNAEFLVIGGGGQSTALISDNGVTSAARGGGGAGGYISSISGESSGGGTSALSPVGLTTGGATYTVTVGAAGSNSVFSGTNNTGTAFNHTAIRGGGTSQSGGSGGGGNPDTTSTGGAGTSGQGFAGGNGATPFDECMRQPFFCVDACKYDAYMGGGGGAGAAGNGKNGGNGVASSVTGSSVTYAGGGAGRSVCNTNFQTGSVGTGQSNYGGGGTLNGVGQNGVVFLKYPTTMTISNPGGGLTMSTSVVSGNNVTTITAGTGNIEFTEV